MSSDATKQPGGDFQFPPFVVECGDGKNSGIITVDALKLRLRGRAARANWRGNGGFVSKLPDIPGIRLEVSPRDLKVRIFDPLESDKALRDRIERTIRETEAPIRDANGSPVNPWPEAVHELDVHTMKTLLLEIARKTLVGTNEDARFFYNVQGEVPSLDALKRTPGNELFDPWNTNPRKPKFKKDAEAWMQRLERNPELADA